jgi:hypothetical protein
MNSEVKPTQHIPTRSTRNTSHLSLLYFYPKRCKL